MKCPSLLSVNTIRSSLSRLPGDVESDRLTAQTRLTTRVPTLLIQGCHIPRELSKLQPVRTSRRLPLIIKSVKNNSMNRGRGRSRGRGGRRDQSITHLRRQIATLRTELRDANTGRFSTRTLSLLTSSKETKTTMTLLHVEHFFFCEYSIHSFL